MLIHGYYTMNSPRELVEKTGVERLDYIQRYFGKDYFSSQGFDVKINTTNLSNEMILNIVSMLLKEKSG